ncbi:MAG TPA: type II secretion system F family protein [Alphaproteobacteria bacterium]|nr:type II secretion system F family protein [Alphaproteobacteria bacterium]
MDGSFHNPNLISALCGLAAFAVVVLIWQALIERDPLPADRLKAVTQHRDALAAAERQKKMTRRAGIRRIGLMKQVVNWFKLARGKRFDALRLKLARAGYRSRDAMFAFMFAKLAGLGGAGFGGVFFLFVFHVGKFGDGPRFLIALAAALGGWLLPNLLVKNKAQKREDVLRKAMPDALDLLVICAEAGLSLDAGFDRVSREMASSAPELAEEIGLTSVELGFLPDRAKALQGLADRVPLPGVLALANTLLQTERYGTPLAQALRVLSAEMREERIMKAEEKAARLPAILTVPMIIFILPPLFVVLIGPAAIRVAHALHGMHH